MRPSTQSTNIQSQPQQIEILCGPMLLRLRVWTEGEWAVLPEAERPARFTHAPGLGWVGAVPTCGLN